jgi:hypothetical protein
LRGEAAFGDLVEGSCGSRVECDGERSTFAELVLHGPNGLIERVDDKVCRASADDFAEMLGIVVDSKADSACDIGCDGERRALRRKPELKNERTRPIRAEPLEGRIRAKDLGLDSHLKEIVTHEFFASTDTGSTIDSTGCDLRAFLRSLLESDFHHWVLKFARPPPMNRRSWRNE